MVDLDGLRLKLVDKLVSGELVIRESDKYLDGGEKLLVLFDVKRNKVVSHLMMGIIPNRLGAVDTFLNDILE